MTIQWSKLIVAGLVGGMMIAQANAAMIVPAKYASGTVTAVDQAKGEVTVGDKTFQAEPADLKSIYAGTDLQIQYLDENGRLRAMWITVPVREPAEERLVD